MNATLEFQADEMSTDESPINSKGNIYVIDDELQVLEVIEMQLTAVGYNVKSFSRPTEFLSQLESLPKGIVISDQRMPEVEGLGVQQAVKPYPHKFQLILLSGYPETRVAVEAMKQGAVTVLDKPYNKEQLLSSIEEAFDQLRTGVRDDAGLPPILPGGETYGSRLSSRERQVIDLVYEGETNKSIGIKLGISIKTVEKHRGKAMRKMEVSSLAELVRLIDREQRG
ncbi:MAG: response regulator [Planctomycetaceae bacterium]|nr:response regulator [Planctomycetaceae bacterium]